MKKRKELTRYQQLFCGGVAGFFSDCIAHPLDLVRARIIMQRKVKSFHYTGTINAFRSLVKTDGIRGLYRGYIPVFFCTFPAHALYFFSYEKTKKLVCTALGKRGEEDNFLVNILCGFPADVCGSLVWCPMEVMKQNAMITSRSQTKVISEIYARDGVRGFYRGFFAQIATFAPYVMLNFAFYERFKSLASKLLKKRRDSLSPYIHFLCATGSSGISSLLTTPLSVGRTRIQCGKGNTNIVKEMVNVMKEEGVYALLEVWNARALWFAVGTATTFMMYEYAKNKILSKEK